LIFRSEPLSFLGGFGFRLRSIKDGMIQPQTSLAVWWGWRKASPLAPLSPERLECLRMTAVASVYTPEGFAIGADGRRRDGGTGLVTDENVQKVFRLSGTNFSLGLAWAGAVVFRQLSGDLFNFAEESKLAGKKLEAGNFRHLSEFAVAFADEIYFRCGKYSGTNIPLYEALSDGNIACVQLVGYVDGIPRFRASSFLPHRRCDTASPTNQSAGTTDNI
jgi:hypothetical protein